MNLLHLRFLAVVVPVLALAGGCSSVGGVDQSRIKDMPIEAVIGSSDRAAASGDNEKALALLDAGAKAYPAAPQPWLKKAQIYFKAGNYPSAILAAEEAIQRDPLNEEAKSVALVSSLRIAVKYVSDLRALNDLKGDARPDAEQLARKLRDTLNATVLVPTGSAAREVATEADGRYAQPRYRRPAPAVQPVVPKAPPPATQVDSPASGSKNPFGSLK